MFHPTPQFWWEGLVWKAELLLGMGVGILWSGGRESFLVAC